VVTGSRIWSRFVGRFAAGFEGLVKCWGKYLNVCGDYVEK